MGTGGMVTTKRYVGRRVDSIVLNTTLDLEAVEILRQYCPPGRRATGKFLARLLYEFDARQQERMRVRGQLVAVLEEEVKESPLQDAFVGSSEPGCQ